MQEDLDNTDGTPEEVEFDTGFMEPNLPTEGIVLN